MEFSNQSPDRIDVWIWWVLNFILRPAEVNAWHLPDPCRHRAEMIAYCPDDKREEILGPVADYDMPRIKERFPNVDQMYLASLAYPEHLENVGPHHTRLRIAIARVTLYTMRSMALHSPDPRVRIELSLEARELDQAIKANSWTKAEPIIKRFKKNLETKKAKV